MEVEIKAKTDDSTIMEGDIILYNAQVFYLLNHGYPNSEEFQLLNLETAQVKAQVYTVGELKDWLSGSLTWHYPQHNWKLSLERKTE